MTASTLDVGLARLTPEQQRIVEWDEGPAVVIAGAGTGKTRVIVERVRRLLDRHDELLPEQIVAGTCALTADEGGWYCGPPTKGADAGTIHIPRLARDA